MHPSLGSHIGNAERGALILPRSECKWRLLISLEHKMRRTTGQPTRAPLLVYLANSNRGMWQGLFGDHFGRCKSRL
jgi:hypothetical protein